jgi:hypothetical protein
MSHQICDMENTVLVPGEILNDVRSLESHAHCRVQGIRGQLVLVNVFRPEIIFIAVILAQSNAE